MLDLAAWIVGITFAATFVVETAFMQVASAKRALAMGVRLPIDVRVVSAFWLVVGFPADIVFNLTRGTWIFRELPKWGEWTFTARVKRHYRAGPSKRYRTAVYWFTFLNAVDHGHIREIGE
jgi:hypothetical protein